LPSFDDVNEKVEFDLSFIIEAKYELVSNGELIKSNYVDRYANYVFNMRQPMSSYLVALTIGKYNKKVETSKSGIPLIMYYYPEDSLKVEPTYRYTKRMFDFLEDEIGVAYPWQNYKQVPVHDFLYSGMENTSLTIFSDAFVIDETAFVDKNYVNVNAHELAHQWFGDLVTETSGTHHWLQEGFATYYALLAERDIFGDDYYYWKLYESAQQLLEQDKLDKGTSLLNPKSSSLTFYQRGAWVLHALREKVGDKAFKEAVVNYLQKHQFKNVETNDFISEVEKSSGQDLKEFVDLWLIKKAFPFNEAMDSLKAHSYFIQEYLMVDCTLMNSKCDYYLTSGVSDEAKSKIIAQVPELITSEVFKSNIKVRQAIAQSLTEIPSKLKTDYESLLEDESYQTIEMALYNLWINFPEDRLEYFEITKDVVGFNTKNVRLLWLTLALVTPDFSDEQKQLFYNELVSYTANDFNFEVRKDAFTYLHSLNAFNKEALQNLLNASKHHNWRLQRLAKNLIEELSVDDNYRKILKPE
jgi:aminopeptidase N